MTMATPGEIPQIGWSRYYIENYAWCVLPINVVVNGACTCGDSECARGGRLEKNMGKHPVRSGWQRRENGFSRIADTAMYWSSNPHHNIGLLLGAASGGVVAIDVDPRNGGDEALELWEDGMPEPLPVTLTARTGSGGRHLFYRLPAGESVPSKNLYSLVHDRGERDRYRGVEIKSDGTQVVLCPSRHPSGNYYTWEDLSAPMMELPAVYREFCRGGKTGGRIDAVAGDRAEVGVGAGTMNAAGVIRQVLEEGTPLVRGSGTTHEIIKDVAWAKAREYRAWEDRHVGEKGGPKCQRVWDFMLKEFLPAALPGGHEDVGEVVSLIRGAIDKVEPLPIEKHITPGVVEWAQNGKAEGFGREKAENGSVDVLGGSETVTEAGEVYASRAGVGGEASAGVVEAAKAKMNGAVVTPAGAVLGAIQDGAGAGSDGRVTGTSESRIHPLSDHGNAYRFVDLFGEDFRYTNTLGWMEWKGMCWAPCAQEHVGTRAREVIAQIHREALRLDEEGETEAAEEVRKWGGRSEHVSRILAIPTLVKSDDRILVVDDTIWDEDPWALNFMNGTLHLNSDDYYFTEHRREDMITKRVRANWDPMAQAPHWHEFLSEVIPEKDVRDYIQRAIGYALTGVVREKAMFILLGEGENGKSVFTENIAWILGGKRKGKSRARTLAEREAEKAEAKIGGYAAKAATDTLLDRPTGGIPNDVAALAGVRYVLASETAEGRHLNVTLVKEITGGDVIKARFMRQEFFEYAPEMKIFLATNDMPVVNDIGNAIWKRLKFIPFVVQIPDERQIVRDVFDAILRKEADGIMAWAVQGCLEWQRIGLAEPASIVSATWSEREDQDWFNDWFNECCVDDASSVETASELIASYNMWSVSRGEKFTMSPQRLGRTLKKKGYFKRIGKGGTKQWGGLRIRRGGSGSSVAYLPGSTSTTT